MDMEEKNNNTQEIIIYQTDDGAVKIDVQMADDTVWLTQQQMAELYQTSKSNVSEHIKHIFEEGELQENSVVRKFRTTASDGKKTYEEAVNYSMTGIETGDKILLGESITIDVYFSFLIKVKPLPNSSRNDGISSNINFCNIFLKYFHNYFYF